MSRVADRATKPGSLDAFTHAVDLMGAEIVHHHNVARPQLGTEHGFQIGEEDFAIGGRLDGHGGEHAVVVHRAQDGEHFPVPARYGIVDPFSARRPCIGAGHLR